MSLFRKFTSRKNSKGVIGDSSGNDLHTRRLAELRPCKWLHNAFMEGARILQELTQYAANAGLTDFIAAECEQITPEDIVAYRNNLATTQAEPQQRDPWCLLPSTSRLDFTASTTSDYQVRPKA